MNLMKLFILSMIVTLNLQAKDIKMVDIYREESHKGALGLEVDGEENIIGVYTIDAGVRRGFKMKSIRSGLPVIEKYGFDIVSVTGKDFKMDIGGRLSIKYLTHVSGIMPKFSTTSYELSRSEGSWKLYNASGSAVNKLKFIITYDAKGKEAGIKRIDSL